MPSQDPRDDGYSPQPYAPDRDAQRVVELLKRRVPQMKQARKAKLNGLDRSIEDIWNDCDRELVPHELGMQGSRKRFEADEEDGLRARRVEVGEDGQWQADAADPVFYVKLTTALSILVEQNPEAVFIPASSRYEKNTAVAYANWKNSWESGNAKQQVKLAIFNQGKYGTAYGKSYPKIVETEKRIRTEFYPDNPKKNKEIIKRLVKFNDICRQSMNPWKVWVHENSRPCDPISVEDYYHETDYSWDKFHEEFGKFPDAKCVAKGALVAPESAEQADPERQARDGVTVGFYENQVADQYAVWVPSQGIVLYHSPLPNDDGMLSLWTFIWSLRHDECPYGIGIYEIIRQDVGLYDRMKNMTVDQLTLAIYKMFFHKGSDVLGQNGKLRIVPGEGVQVSDPKAITFLEVPPPDPQAWKGLQFLQDKVDTNSGVPQQLSGKFTGNTLGQDIQAKEIALQRMKTPLDFILDGLQQEAYVSLSWMKQMLSVPEILEWSTPEDLAGALEEAGLSEQDIQKYLQEIESPSPNPDLVYQEAMEPAGYGTGEDGEAMDPMASLQPAKEPKKYANVYREVSLGIEQDDKGELIESPDKRFYRFGLHLPLKRLDWKGIVRVKPQSVLAPSKDLEKRNDLDLYNLVFPSIQAMAANPTLVPVLMPPIKQIVKIFEKNVNDWVNVKHFEELYQQALQPKAAPLETKASLSVAFKDIPPDLAMTETQRQIMEKYLGIKVEQPLFVPAGQQAMAGSGLPAQPPAQQAPEAGALPEAPSDAAPGIEPIAQMRQAPQSLGGAYAGAAERSGQ